LAGVACAFSLLLTYGVVRSISCPIQTIASNLMEIGEQVTSAADQVSAASQTLAHDATTQAASLEQTSAANQEISSMAKRNEQPGLFRTHVQHVTQGGGRQSPSGRYDELDEGDQSIERQDLENHQGDR
jgi:hypothetical protein